MNLNEIIAVNLKRLRAERGFSLGKLSELSGVARLCSARLRRADQPYHQHSLEDRRWLTGFLYKAD